MGKGVGSAAMAAGTLNAAGLASTSATTSSKAAADPVRVTRVEVLRGHLICDVVFDPSVPRVTSPQLIAGVLSQFPNLPRHACVNECGETFADVMECTPMPHLLEHMIVDLQVREMASLPGDESRMAADKPIVGTSEWVDEPAGLARIDVSFADDHTALRALRDAVAALNSPFGK
jgi:hypothetical protein